MSAATRTFALSAPVPVDWRERAACRGLETTLFFPGRGESTVAATAVCSACVVRRECLSSALGDRPGGGAERFGVWGGTTERQRRRLRRQTRLGTAVAS